MSDKENRVKIEICGQPYILKGSESPEYMKELSKYVDEKIKQVQSRNPKLSLDKAAVLAAINIADELKKFKADYEELVRIIENR
ncbi:cell division protein ZapA [Peptococcaceae bacterium]|nr:cell division protein ZapA [Peptococcaceae bacterium]